MLNSIPPEAWTGLVGAFTGAFLSLVGSWLTSKTNIKQLKLQLSHEEKVALRSIKRERFEELYVLISHWSNELFGHYLDLTLVMKGQMDYNSYLDRIIDRGDKNEFDFNRLKMIIDIYGADLKHAFSDVLKVREEWNDLVYKHKRAYQSGEVVADYFLDDAGKIQLKLEGAVEKFRKLIAETITN